MVGRAGRGVPLMDIDIMLRYNKYRPGRRRESNRTPPLWMAINMFWGRCWCGRPRDQWEPLQRKYCCYEHARFWTYYIHAYWQFYREVLVRAVAMCEKCGRKFPPTVTASYDWGDTYNYHEGEMEVDHIQAISLGGEMWDSNNHRVLCRPCHKSKTREDVRKLAARRRTQRATGGVNLEAFL